MSKKVSTIMMDSFVSLLVDVTLGDSGLLARRRENSNYPIEVVFFVVQKRNIF